MQRWVISVISAGLLLSGCSTSSSSSSPAPSANVSLSAVTAVPSKVLIGQDISYSVHITGPSALAARRGELSATSSLSLKAINLPTGFSRLSSSTCSVGQSLSTGQSCVLNLTAHYSAATTVSTALSIVTSSGTVKTPVSFSVLAAATADMPNFSAQTQVASLIPGNTISYKVTNNSTKAVNTPQLSLPEFLNSVVTNKNLSYNGDLAPGASYTFGFTIPNTVEFTNEQVTELNTEFGGALKLVAANSAPVNVLTRALNEMTANSIGFSSVSPQTITVHNQSKFPMVIDGVANELPVGVSQSGDTCSDATVAVDSSCSVTYTVLASAHGSGSATITYHPQGVEKTFTLNPSITVDKANVLIGSIPSFKVGATSGSFTLAVSGHFGWHVPADSAYAVIQHGDGPAPDSHFTLHATSGCEAGDTLTQSGCHFAISADSTTTPGEYDFVTSGSSNALQKIETFTVLPGDAVLSVSVDGGWSGRGMATQRFVVTNTGEAGSSLVPTLAWSDNTNDAIEMESSGEDRCVSGSTSLSQGDSCYIYLRAKNTEAVGAQTLPTLTVSAPDTISKNINLVYSQSLYIAARHHEGSNVYTNYVSRYNGSSWSDVNGVQSFNSVISALAVSPITGDIYAAGSFTDGTNQYVTAYNGSSWTSIGSGPDATRFNSSIRQLTFMPNGDLYAAGDITLDGDAYYVAKYSGGAWSNAGSAVGLVSFDQSIYALRAANDGSKLYVGGLTTSQGSAFVAQYDTAGSSWSMLGGSVISPGATWALAVAPNDDVYAGTFTVGDDSYSDKLFNGTSWSDIDGYDDPSYGGGASTFLVTSADGSKLYSASSYINGGYKYFVAQRVAGEWTKISPEFSDPITHIVVSPASSGDLYVLARKNSNDDYTVWHYNGSTWVNIGAAADDLSLNIGGMSGMVIAPKLSVFSIS